MFSLPFLCILSKFSRSMIETKRYVIGVIFNDKEIRTNFIMIDDKHCDLSTSTFLNLCFPYEQNIMFQDHFWQCKQIWVQDTMDFFVILACFPDSLSVSLLLLSNQLVLEMFAYFLTVYRFPGSGRFLMWLAKRNPGSKNYLGLEIRQKV